MRAEARSMAEWAITDRSAFLVNGRRHGVTAGFSMDMGRSGRAVRPRLSPMISDPASWVSAPCSCKGDQGSGSFQAPMYKVRLISKSLSECGNFPFLVFSQEAT